MNSLTHYGALLLFVSSLALTACSEQAGDHGHPHEGEAAHQHDDNHGRGHDGDDHAHDAMQSAPETEAFYADDNESLESSKTVENTEETDDHHHDHERGEHGHDH